MASGTEAASGHDTAWERWCTEYDNAYKDVLTLFHNRHVWLSVHNMWQTAPDVEMTTVVRNWLTRMYVVTQVAGIRRECDPDRRTASLLRCLDQLIANPAMVSRVRFEGLIDTKPDVDDELKREMKKGYDAFAEPGATELSKTKIGKDRTALNGAFQQVRSYTNKRLLHREVNAQDLELTLNWEDLDNALNIVGKTLKRYHQLRHPGTFLFSVTPEMPLGWAQAFAAPWLSSDFQQPSTTDVDEYVPPSQSS